MEDSPENVLKKRLYKNMSTKTLRKNDSPATLTLPALHPPQLLNKNPHPLLLSSSQSKFNLRKYQEEDVLVPKILTDSHRKELKHDRSMLNFKEGKILLVDQNHTNHHHHHSAHPAPGGSSPSAEQSHGKNKKDPILKNIETNILSNEAKAIIEDQKALEQKKQRIKRGEQRNLTPKHIFNFFDTFPEMQLDFFYLNKVSHPYDYRIVPFNECNLNKYMTISSKGVTQYINKEAYFMTREEWLNEENMYYRLQEIDFFKNYKINKNFRIWKNMMKRHYMREMSNLLNQKLFLAGSTTRNAILNIRYNCLLLEEEAKIMNYEAKDPVKMTEFEQAAIKYQQEEFVETIGKYEELILHDLSISIDKSIEDYKKENNIVTEVPATKGTAGVVVNSNKNKECLNYSQEALLRMEYIKVLQFIRLVDAIVMESKIKMIHHNADLLLTNLVQVNEQRKEEWFLCTADWNAEGMVWNPDRAAIKNSFYQILNSSLALLQDRNIRLQTLPQFQKYLGEEDLRNADQNNKDDKISLRSLCLESEDYKRRVSEITNQLDEAFDRVEGENPRLIKFVEIYQKHLKENQDVAEVERLAVAELRRTITEYKQEDVKMETMPQKLELGLILADLSELRSHIRNKPMESLGNLLRALPEVLVKKCDKLHSIIRVYIDELNNYPREVKKFVIFTKSVNKVSNQLEDLTAASRDLIQLVAMMEELKTAGIEKYKMRVKEAASGVTTLKSKIDEANANYNQNLNKFKEELTVSVAKIEVVLTELLAKYEEIPLTQKSSNIYSMIDFLESIQALVEELHTQATETNELENQLGLPKTEFTKFHAFYTQFKNMEKLWCGRKNWGEIIQKIKGEHCLKVNLEQLKTSFQETKVVASGLLATMPSNEACKLFLDEVETFDMVIKTLDALHDPHLREKEEWTEIPQFLYKCKHPGNYDISYIQPNSLPLGERNNPEYTVNWLINESIYMFRDQLAYFGTKAAKQEELNKELKNIKDYMAGAEIVLVNYKDTKDSYVLGNNSALFAGIDDKLITINNILSSKYVENIRSKVENLSQQFRYLQDLFTELVMHQNNWLYLEPLLSNSSYSAKNLSKESKDFLACDSIWKRVSKTFRENPTCKRIAQDYNSKTILKALIKNNTNFETIRKSLDEFIERKRIYFPRFYFLSNSELLEILSKAKTPESINVYLEKVFPHSRSMIFDKEQPLSIINSDNETLVFKQFVLRSQIQVDQLLKNVDEQIKKTLSQNIRQALARYEEEELTRFKLLEQYTTQIALVTDWIFWTKLGEDYLAPDAVGDLYDWYEVQNQQITEVADSIRKSFTDELKKKSLSALLLQSIYLKEATEEMYKRETSSVHEYQWLKTVKFYLSHNAPELTMKQTNTRLIYGFQLQSSASNSAYIAPQTEKVWLNIAQTLESKEFACLVGDVGCGKTQSVSQLASLLAQPCLMFNLAANFVPKTIERTLTGVLITGSWVCFQNLWQAKSELLSTLACQLQLVKRALLQNKESVMLAKSTISINPSFNIMFTQLPNVDFHSFINPVLRKISFIQPSHGIVLQALLEADLWTEPKKLAQSIMSILEYTSQIVSNGIMYNRDMRTIKQIAKEALNERSKVVGLSNPVPEETMILNVLKTVMMPKLSSIHQDTFLSIASQIVFSEGEAIAATLLMAHTNTTSSFKQSMAAVTSNESFDQVILTKTKQLIKSLEDKKGVVVVGAPFTGKSWFIKNAAKHMDLKVHFVCQDSIGKHELFGTLQTEGLLPNLIKSIEKQAEKPEWVVYDGELYRQFEQLNSVIDEQKVLILPSAQKIKIANTSLIFETESLRNITPAILSRVSVINLTKKSDLIEHLVEDIIEKNMNESVFTSETRKTLGNQLVSGLRKLIGTKKPYNLIFTKEEGPLAQSAVRNLVSLCSTFTTLGTKDPKEMKKLLDKIIIWSLAWTFGGLLSPTNIGKFQKVLGEIYRADNLPPGSLYSYCINPSTWQWNSWDSLSDLHINPQEAGQQYTTISIPTTDTKTVSYFLRQSVKFKYPLLLLGAPGTGKRSAVNRYVQYAKKQSLISYLPISVTKESSSQETESMLEQRMQKFRKAGELVILPPPGKALFVQIQDIELDSRDNSQSLEFFRAILAHQGLYDRNNYTWKNFSDIAILGLGRIPERDLTHERLFNNFQILSLTEKRETAQVFFNGYVNNWLKIGSIKEQISKFLTNGALVQTTLNLYHALKPEFAQKDPLGYSLSYKSVAEVFNSILRVNTESLTKPEQLAKLWANEILRTFSDRLTNQDCKQMLRETILKQVLIGFELHFPPTYFSQPAFFSYGVESPHYQQVTIESLYHHFEVKMVEMPNKFNLILFKELVQNIVKAIRVITIQNGHLLISGNEGTGRKSILQLAAFISGVIYDPYEGKSVKGSKLLEALFKASQGLHTCMVVDHSELASPQAMRLVVNTLNKVYQPLPLTKQQQDVIASRFTEQTHMTGDHLSNIFFEHAYRFLHVVVLATPHESKNQHSNMAVIMSKYPSIIENCNIMMVQAWPEEAFISVAKNSLAEETEQMWNLVLKFHSAVENTVKTMSNESEVEVPGTWVSPKKYIELLNIFNSRLKTSNDELTFVVQKLFRAISKYEQINQLSIFEEQNGVTLENTLKSLAITQQDLLKTLDTKEAALTDLRLQTDQNKEQDKEAQIKQNLSDINDKKSKVIQSYHNACDILNKISRQEILEFKNTQQPVAPVIKMVFEAVCLVLEENASDWSQIIKKLFADSTLLSRIRILQIGSIKQETFERVSIILLALKKQDLSKHNSVINTLATWLNSLKDSAQQFLELIESQHRLLHEIHNIHPGHPKEMLKLIEEISDIEAAYSTLKSKKESIESEMKRSRQKLKSAREVLVALKEEHEEWQQLHKESKEKIEGLKYHLFMDCSCFQYLGPFPPAIRNVIIQKWKEILKESGIKFDENFKTGSVLFDPFEIQSLNNHTKENLLSCLIMLKSPFTPYIMDPNHVAQRYINNIYSNLKILTSGEENFEKKLETFVKNGSVVIVDCSEDTTNPGGIEPCMIPLLKKNFLTSGTRKIVKLTQTPIEYSENFKLFLINHNVDFKMVPDLYQMCSVINFEVTAESIREFLQEEIYFYINPEKLQSLTEIEKKLTDLTLSMKEQGERIINMISTLGTDPIKEMEIVSDLIKIKNRKDNYSMDLKNQNERKQKIRTELEEHRTFAEKTSRLMHFLIKTLNSKVLDTSINLTFRKLRDILKNSIMCSLQESIVSCNNQNPAQRMESQSMLKNGMFYDKVLSSVLQIVMNALPSRHSASLKLLMALAIENHYDIESSQEQYLWLTEPGNSKKSFWAEIKACSTQSEMVKKLKAYWKSLFFMHITDSTDIQLLLQTEKDGHISSSGSGKLNLFEILVLTRMFFPDRLKASIEELVTQKIHMPQKKNTSMDLIDILYPSSKLTSPLFLLSFSSASESQPDIIGKILNLSKQKKISSDFVGIMNISAEEDLQIQKLYESYTWCVIRDVDISVHKKQLLRIVDFIQKLEQNAQPLKDDFRFIILLACKSNRTRCPPSISDKATQHYFEKSSYLDELASYELIDRHVNNFSQSSKISYLRTNCTRLVKVFLEAQHHMGLAHESLSFDMEKWVDSSLGIMTGLLENNELESIRSAILDVLPVTHKQEYSLWEVLLQNHLPDESNQNSGTGISTISNKDGVQLEYNPILLQNLIRIRATHFVSDAFSFFRWDHKKNKSLTNEVIDAMLQLVPHTLSLADRVASDSFKLCLYKECQAYNHLTTVVRNDIEALKPKTVVLKLSSSTIPNCENSNLIECVLSNRVPDHWAASYHLPRQMGLQEWIRQLKENHQYLRKWWIKEERPRQTIMNAFFYPRSYFFTALEKYARKMKIPIDRLYFAGKFFSVELNVNSNSSSLNNNTSVINDNSADNFSLNITDLSLALCRYDTNKGLLEEIGQEETDHTIFKKYPLLQLIPAEKPKQSTLQKENNCGTHTIVLPICRSWQDSRAVWEVELQAKRKPEYWQLNMAKSVCHS